ncbi:MAG TPA: 4Fe-4S dicluster domain-containing protein [Candidatus Sulfomarinibacteraceae bacterium]|nr:4Fe-4S dicluster domain-containing protein [Candidatus Sulfomarinibacteraceae bacterium]
MTVALENARGARGAPDTRTPRGTSPFSPLSIAVDRCKGCELCIGACAHGVLALDTGVVNPLGYHPVRLVDPAGCTSCALCARVCPDAVFTVFAPRKATSR